MKVGVTALGCCHLVKKSTDGKVLLTNYTVIICTVDSDVVVLAVYMFAKLTPSLTALWVAFGTGKNYRLIPDHRISTAIGHMKCLAIPIFHAFTGCDTVSSFSGRGKKTAWET